MTTTAEVDTPGDRDVEEVGSGRPVRDRLIGAVRGRSPRMVFWLSWVLLTALAGTWALANPMAASPDEPAHVIRAAALVNQAPLAVERAGVWSTELPHIYGLMHVMPGCYAFRSTEPASCWPQDFGDVSATERMTTSAGNYNPLYYAIVGLPTLLPPSLSVLYLMRLVSAALCTLCLALGLRTVAEVGARSWTVVGAAVATTPMVVYMTSTVNPNAIEAAAGLGLWLTLVLALRRPDPSLVTRRWWRAALLVTLLVNAKALSPLYLAIIVVSAVLLARWSDVRDALTDRRTWAPVGVGAAASAAAVAWILHAGAVSGAGVIRFPEMTTERALNDVLRLTSSYVNQMIGRFGWHDTPAPGTVYIGVAAALGLVVILALAAGRARESATLLGLTVAVVLLPIVLQVPAATQVGLPWQGRYLLAVAVGVPIVAGVLCDAGLGSLSGRVATRALVVVVAVLTVAQGMSFWHNLRRYVAGTDAPWFEPLERSWSPPVPGSLLLAAAIVVLVAIAVLLVWLGSGRDDRPGAPSAALGADRATRETPVLG